MPKMTWPALPGVGPAHYRGPQLSDPADMTMLRVALGPTPVVQQGGVDVYSAFAEIHAEPAGQCHGE